MSTYAWDHTRDVRGGTVRALHQGTEVGSLDFETFDDQDAPGTAFVSSVQVHPGHQRHGVATGMADYLHHGVGLRPTFDYDGNTPAGSEWINYMLKRSSDEIDLARRSFED